MTALFAGAGPRSRSFPLDVCAAKNFWTGSQDFCCAGFDDFQSELKRARAARI